jgi:hypothetical protein
MNKDQAPDTALRPRSHFTRCLFRYQIHHSAALDAGANDRYADRGLPGDE